MAKFKMKISIDNEPIMKARADRLEEFDPIFTEIKAKFNGRKK